MMTIKNLLVCAAIAFLFGCDGNAPVTRRSDYVAYLVNNDSRTEKLNNELAFWTGRFAKQADHVSLVKMAGLRAEKFRQTLDRQDIVFADSVYQSMIPFLPASAASVHRALAQNAIARHDFQSAYAHAIKAYNIGDEKALSAWVVFDAALELGDARQARRVLTAVTNKHSFQYLIREAKLMDHEGDLDGAIVCFERALESVGRDAKLRSWSWACLGDMYGHAGRIEASYGAYLNALQEDAGNWYALKGIAWIALSHDGDFQVAREIVHFLIDNYSFTAGYLMLAEMAAAESDADRQQKWFSDFRAALRDTLSQHLYARPLALIEAEHHGRPDAAIAIADSEIRNRPTAGSYDLLAWGYYQKGEWSKALDIAQKHVMGRSHEPLVAYHLGKIFQAAGHRDEAIEWLTEAGEARFELGPVIAADIDESLQERDR